MKDLDLYKDSYEIVEIKRAVSLAMIKMDGRVLYVQRDMIPRYRRMAYYEKRQAEDRAYGSQGQL